VSRWSFVFRVLGLVLLAFVVFDATPALAQGAGGDDDFDWGDLGGVGIGAAVGGIAGAGASLLGARTARETTREERREAARQQRTERIASDIRALASEAAGTHRQLSAFLGIADAADLPPLLEVQAARDAVRTGIGEVGWRREFITDDELRTRAAKYATKAAEALNSSERDDRRQRYRAASDELNALMARAGELYRDVSAEDVARGSIREAAA
jgi:hypothetical protein